MCTYRVAATQVSDAATRAVGPSTSPIGTRVALLQIIPTDELSHQAKGFLAMRISALSLRMVTAVVFTMLSQADAAPPNQPSTTVGRTAVIDLGHIFDNSTSVKMEVEKIRRDGEAATKQFQAAQDKLKLKAGELKNFKKGSDEYARREAAIMQEQSTMKVKAQLIQKQFQDRRSKIYYAAYLQVEELVRLYSQNNGIALVLRTNAKPAEAPQTTAQRMQRIQRPILFEQNIDITVPILEELNRRAVSLSKNEQLPNDRNDLSPDVYWQGLF